MKKSLLCIFVLAFASAVNAQNPILSPTVVSTGGNYSSYGGVSLSSTIGEMAAVQTLFDTPNNVILTQGFEQPNDKVTGLLSTETGPDAFVVYPVPATQTEWYGYEFAESGNVVVSLYDIAGRKMDYSLMEPYDSGKLVHSFNCSSYASGNYVLSVKFTGSSGQEKVLSKEIVLVTK